MDPPYQLQPIDVEVDGLSQLYPDSGSPVLGIESMPSALLSNISPQSPYIASDLRQSNITLQSSYTAPDLRPSNVSSPQSNSYYSAISSPSYSTTTNTASTWSSNNSFPYSVTSINSRKSRMNVLYPRRSYPLPLPAPVLSESSPYHTQCTFFSSYFL